MEEYKIKLSRNVIINLADIIYHIEKCDPLYQSLEDDISIGLEELLTSLRNLKK